MRSIIDCSAELARYENIEDELFLQYYEIDPVDVLQRAFERSLAECKEEVSLVLFLLGRVDLGSLTRGFGFFRV